MQFNSTSFLGTLALGLVFLTQSIQGNSYVELGPMLGHVGSHEARIWVKASQTARLSVKVGVDASLEKARLVDGPALTDMTDHNGHIQVAELNPSTRYYYNVLLDGKPCLAAPYPSFETAPLKSEVTRLRFAFGSCVGHEGVLASAAWGQMAADSSIEMLLMLGDNHYADSTVPEVQRAAYYDHRSVSGFRDLVKRMPVYGIWDDHDYGPNDSDSTAEGQQISLQTFQSMWANPSYGEPDNPGTYYQFSYGDIDFFMLDDRYYRSPNSAKENGSKTMLGERQWQWLKQELKQSKAKLKFIASGSEWQKNGHRDSWTSFKREQLGFFDWIDQENIEGVILLSGDRHFTGGYQINQRVIEITSGPLGSNNYPTPNLPEMFLNHGTGKLYCVFDIDTRKDTPKVVLEVHRAGEGLIDRRDFTMAEINGKARLATLPVRPTEPTSHLEVSDLPLVKNETFESGAGQWTPTDANAWRVIEQEGSKVYSLHRQSDYKPIHRSPLNYSLLNEVWVGDFDLYARVITTQRDYGHRSMCLFFGWQDPEHFYYTHLGQKTDDHANQVFIVNDAPRVKISTRTTPGTPWDSEWHTVKIKRRVESGLIEVYWDDMNKPIMTATDKTFTWGRVGLGAFDDTGNWDDIRLYGVEYKRPE
ncbi:MAG: hypothetical protein HOH33_14470 [Verrucomicrobia bacterium]|jgi:alkaline phosphatase D|nr:hypothetical protein [Verrucomicrobiota bacterium]